MRLEQLLPFIIGILTATLILTVAIAANKYLNAVSRQGLIENQIDDLINDFNDEEDIAPINTKPSLADRWNRGWDESFKAAGVKRYIGDPKAAGREMALLSVISIVALGFILGNLALGVMAGVLLVSIVGMRLRAMKAQKVERMDQQLDGLLSALKSRLQSGEGIERAFVNVAKVSKDPLREELMKTRNDIEAGLGFVPSIQGLRDRTPSRDLRFLCSCLIQASGEGSGVEKQIEKIQEVMSSRRDINDEIAIAMKEPKPAVWLSTFIIPGMFFYSYATSTTPFWFVEPISWVAFIAVVVFYGIGMYLMNKMVDKIKNL